MDRTRPIEEIYRTLLEMEEADWIEAKALHGNSYKSLLETVCAFANEPHLGGGCILVGVAEDRERHDGRFWVDGVEHPDKAQADIATQCATVFNQPIRPAIKAGIVEGKTVLAVFVDELPPVAKPLFFKSSGLPQGAFRRIGSTDQRCTEEELASFFGRDEAFDGSSVPGALVAEADPAALAHYRRLRSAVNPAAEELSLDDSGLLRALGCVRLDNPGELNLAGVLLFGSAALQRRVVPAVRVDYIRVSGNTWVENPGEEFRSIDMRGPLLILAERVVDAVFADLPRGFRLTEESLQAQNAGLPVRALREAVVNALMHRSYRIHQPTQVIRYDNRIEIVNAGISLKPDDELGQPGSRIRNPILANAFHDTNLAETKGTGIRRMQRLMREGHLAPPTFESDRRKDSFTLRLLLHHFLGETDLAWLRRFGNLPLDDGQKTALVFLRETGALDNVTYRQMNGMDPLQAGNALRKLRQWELLDPRGHGAATYYVPGPGFVGQVDSEEETSHGEDAKSHGGAVKSHGEGVKSHGAAIVSHGRAEAANVPGGEQSATDDPGRLADGIHTNTVLCMKNGALLFRDGKLLFRTDVSVVRGGRKIATLPPKLAGRVNSLKRRVSNPLKLECLVYDLCAWFPLTRDELAQLLHRKSQYVRKLISAMIGKHLDYTIPDMIRHPDQAYKAIPGHRPGQSSF